MKTNLDVEFSLKYLKLNLKNKRISPYIYIYIYIDIDIDIDTYTWPPGSSAGKESAFSAGDPGSIPGLRRSPGKGIGYPL